MSFGGRDTYDPRKRGIAQKVQRRSHPEAIFSGADGALVSRRRWLSHGAVVASAREAPPSAAFADGDDAVVRWPGIASVAKPR